MNHLVVIGFLGGSTAYLNLSAEEAVARHIADGDYVAAALVGRSIEEIREAYLIEEFDFEDSFDTYTACPRRV